jgi:hypothetical protein
LLSRHHQSAGYRWDRDQGQIGREGLQKLACQLDLAPPNYAKHAAFHCCVSLRLHHLAVTMPPTAKDPAKTDPPRKRVGSRHDKTGCLTCRCRCVTSPPLLSLPTPQPQDRPLVFSTSLTRDFGRNRRKKCLENTFPTCGACRRLNLKCIRAPARNVVSSSTSPESNQTSSHSRISNQTELELVASSNQRLAVPSWTPPYASGPGVRVESPHQRHAFRYYVTVLAYHLTVSERFNSFLSGKRVCHGILFGS